MCSPDASGAGADCCATMWSRKREHYADYADDMRQQGLQYLPVVFSCYGRVHPDSRNVLERIAGQAARRLGVQDGQLLLRRARASIGVAIWRRAAAMARACLPKLSPQSAALLLGACDAEADEVVVPACDRVAAQDVEA